MNFPCIERLSKQSAGPKYSIGQSSLYNSPARTGTIILNRQQVGHVIAAGTPAGKHTASCGMSSTHIHPDMRDGRNPCFSSSSSRASTRLSCALPASRAAESIRYGWRDRGLASGSLDFCLAQVHSAAAKGSSWAPENEQHFLDVARAVGGAFLLVQCGLWAAEHPRAGQPALAVHHILCCRVDQQDEPHSALVLPTALQPKKKQKKLLLPPQLLQEPVSGAPNQFYVGGAFMLDESGWPTGVMFNSPSDFEALTTRQTNKRPTQMNILWEGEAQETVGRWAKHNLESRGVQKLTPTTRYHIRTWYNDLMVSAGAKVEWRDDVATLSTKAKNAMMP